MPATIEIDPRFNGSPDAGNGGYTCGLVARHLAGSAEVTLRAPAPLGRALTVDPSDGGVTVRDGETTVAEGRPDGVDLPVPEPPGFDEASAASASFADRWAAHHPFPSCFVCGPERVEGDGFRIFPGPLAGGDLFAATWTPGASLSDAGGSGAGAVAPEHVWAALDCPTSAPVVEFGDGPPCVLGRLAVRIDGAVEVGRPYVIASWAIERAGRKRTSGAAIFTADGELRGVARALWIELRVPGQPG